MIYEVKIRQQSKPPWLRYSRMPKEKFAKYWDKQIPQIEVTNLDLPLFQKKEINLKST